MASRDAAQKSQDDTIEVAEEILKGKAIATDYSGAHEKIDPREIALVRKLDIWIMPILWLMYWLNYLVHDPDCQDRRVHADLAQHRTATLSLSPVSTRSRRT